MHLDRRNYDGMDGLLAESEEAAHESGYRDQLDHCHLLRAKAWFLGLGPQLDARELSDQILSPAKALQVKCMVYYEALGHGGAKEATLLSEIRALAARLPENAYRRIVTENLPDCVWSEVLRKAG